MSDERLRREMDAILRKIDSVEPKRRKQIILPGQDTTPSERDRENQVVASKRSQIELRFVGKHTVFVGLKHMLMEDILWRKENPRIPAMICLQEDHSCSCPFNCMTRLAKRCAWIFDQYPKLQQILILFTRNEPKLIRKKPSRLNMMDLLDWDVDTKVPRLIVLYVPRSFAISMLRVNYDGVQICLKHAISKIIETPFDLWS
jgi:hypothetical protein